MMTVTATADGPLLFRASIRGLPIYLDNDSLLDIAKGNNRACGRQLVGARRRRYHEHMTVAQLLKSAKALPKRERERLVREILALENPTRVGGPSGRRPARVTWPDIETRAKLIVGDRVLPNLVLLERGEEAY